MNITSINNNSGIGFNGKVLARGKNWHPELKEAFLNNAEVKKAAAESHYNIIGKMSKISANKYDDMHIYGEPLYKISLVAENENPSIIDKVKTAFGLNPKMKVTHNYHSFISTLGLMQERLNSSKIKTKLFAEQ